MPPLPLCDLVRFRSGLLSLLWLTRDPDAPSDGACAAAPRNAPALEPRNECFGSHTISIR